MPVIAKMNASSTPYANGTKINLNCVYDTDLAKPENEDVRFTKATPWGQAEMNVPSTIEFPDGPVYVMFTPFDTPPLASQCVCIMLAECASIHDTGYQKTIEIKAAPYGENSIIPAEKRICDDPHRWPSFALKMGVDNEAASVQFEPLKRYWVSIIAPAPGVETVDVLGNARAEAQYWH